MSTATHAQLAAEIASNLPSGNPATLTAASLRQVVTDQIDSLNVAASVVTAVNLSTYQPFVNTASVTASTVLLQIYDGSTAATWGQLNSTAHTIAIIAGASIAATAGISSGSTLSVTGSIAATAGISSGSGLSAVGVMTAQNATVIASTASQSMQMGTTANLGIYFATGQPTVSTAAAGSICLSTGGSGPSTRVWVAGSTGNWIGIVAEA